MLSWSGSVLWAGQPLRWMVTEELVYDDNIYLKKNGSDEKKSSLINAIHVGADYRGKLPQSSMQLSAYALAGGNLYTENPHHNNYIDAAGGLALQGEKLQLSDQIIYTSDPADSSLTERTKRLSNVAHLFYQTSHKKRISFGVIAEDLFDHYFEQDMHYLNRNRVNTGAQIFYNFTPRTNVFAEYIFSDIAYRGNHENNSHSHSADLGLHSQLANKLFAAAKLTYDMRRYSHRIAHADNHPDLLGYYAQLTWKPTLRDEISLSGERRMEETLYGANRYYVDTFLALELKHKLDHKWTASLQLAWENMRYRQVVTTHKRLDVLYTLRPRLDYAFEDWLIGSVWYQYRIRNSNESWADYTSNKIGCTLKVIF